MILKVFTTKRQIRDYLKQQNNTFLPKIITIGEFFQKAVVVEGAKFIDEDLRKIYLYEAIEDVDVEKLGLNKNFLDFFKNSDLIFGFLNEVYLERVDLDEVDMADTYLEFSEHISLLKEIYEKYKNILQKNSLVDKITIDEFRINEGFFENISKIELEVVGYLTKFEREILDKIEVPMEVSFTVSRFNKPLINKMFGDFKEGSYVIDYKSKKVLDYKPLKNSFSADVSNFTKRIDQVNFVFASIKDLVDEGIAPEKIAVVLPDESFSEYLRLFNDKVKNLNFAMGDSFTASDIYKKLKSLYDYYVLNDEISKIKVKDYLEEFENSDILDFIQNNITDKERKILDEELFKFKKLYPFLQNNSKLEILKFLLERFSNLSFDDVSGGKVTVMGVLESRGAEIDGVIVVDFNEEYVPNVNEKDFFLNTAVRKRVNLPTREDKEALQKNYYFSLFSSAKKVKLSFVKNESQNISRFAYELGISEGENKDEYYSEVLYKTTSPKNVEYHKTFEIPKILTPTMLDVLISCPKRYYLSYVLGIKNEEISEEELFGSKFHNVMEEIKNYKFKNDSEYYDFIMNGLLKNADIKEYFYIKTNWDDKIREFAKKDFEFLSGDIKTEVELKKPKENFLLKARFDRIIGNMAFDYKTSKSYKNYNESTQAEFYRYLLPQAKIYFWDIYNVKLIEANPDIKNLDEKIKSIKNVSVKTEDEKNCRFCEYSFSCNI